jgi:hypothetical protein
VLLVGWCYSNKEHQGGLMMFCEKCGQEVSEDAKFCGKCGAPVGGTTKESASGATSDSATIAKETERNQETDRQVEPASKAEDSPPQPLTQSPPQPPPPQQAKAPVAHPRKTAMIVVVIVAAIVLALIGCTCVIGTIIYQQDQATNAANNARKNDQAFWSAFNAWDSLDVMPSGGLKDIQTQKESIRTQRNDALSAGNLQQVKDLSNQGSDLNSKEDAIYNTWTMNLETQSQDVTKIQAKVIGLTSKERSIASSIATKAREANTLGHQLVDLYKQSNLNDKRLVEIYLSIANNQITVDTFNTEMTQNNSDRDKISSERNAKLSEYNAKKKEAEDLYVQLQVLFKSD